MKNEKTNRCSLIDIIKEFMILFIIITHYKWNHPSDYLKYGFVFYIDKDKINYIKMFCNRIAGSR